MCLELSWRKGLEFWHLSLNSSFSNHRTDIETMTKLGSFHSLHYQIELQQPDTWGIENVRRKLGFRILGPAAMVFPEQEMGGFFGPFFLFL